MAVDLTAKLNHYSETVRVRFEAFLSSTVYFFKSLISLISILDLAHIYHQR